MYQHIKHKSDTFRKNCNVSGEVNATSRCSNSKYNQPGQFIHRLEPPFRSNGGSKHLEWGLTEILLATPNGHTVTAVTISPQPEGDLLQTLKQAKLDPEAGWIGGWSRLDWTLTQPILDPKPGWIRFSNRLDQILKQARSGSGTGYFGSDTYRYRYMMLN